MEKFITKEHKEFLVKVKLEADHTDNGIKHVAGTTIEVDKVTADFIVEHNIGKLVN